jgi:hypothetical protein
MPTSDLMPTSDAAVAAGSFNDWNGKVQMQQSKLTGDFVRTLFLPRGKYDVSDTRGVLCTQPEPGGGCPSGRLRSRVQQGAAGRRGVWHLKQCRAASSPQYKYYVDGEWRISTVDQLFKDEVGPEPRRRPAGAAPSCRPARPAAPKPAL